MKKILLFIVMFLLFINDVYANATEDSLNAISAKIIEIKKKTYTIDPLKKYPVGSIYMSTSGTNPGTIFGGTWVAFGQGRTLVGMGSSGTVGSTGGASTISLTSSNLPKHYHTYTAKGSVSSTFTGTASNTSSNWAPHTHKFSYDVSSSEAKNYGLQYNANGTGNDAFANRIIIQFYAVSEKYYDAWEAADNHSHDVTPSGTVSSSFTGTKKNTSNTGSTTSFSVLNPYITVYIWRRTA